MRLELTTYRLTAGRATDCAIQELTQARMAQWIRRLPTEQEIPGSSPGMGFFHFMFEVALVV